MKSIKILGHPLLLTIMFVTILISGESFGGPYIIYLLMAIPHAGIHGLLGMVGIILVFVGLFVPGKGSANGKWRNIIGACCMLLSLLVFFIQDTKGYNYGSFKSTAFIVTALLFFIAVCCFIYKNLHPFNHSGNFKQVKMM